MTVVRDTLLERIEADNPGLVGIDDGDEHAVAVQIAVDAVALTIEEVHRRLSPVEHLRVADRRPGPDTQLVDRCGEGQQKNGPAERAGGGLYRGDHVQRRPATAPGLMCCC